MSPRCAECDNDASGMRAKQNCPPLSFPHRTPTNSTMPPHASENANHHHHHHRFDFWKPDLLCSNPRLQKTDLPRNTPLEHFRVALAVPQKSSLLARPKVRRNVTFCEEVEVFTIPNKDDLPKEDLFTSREEMTNIHREAWGYVDLMNAGIYYEDQQYFSKRGLDDLTDENIERRKVIRERGYKIIFGVQAFGQHKVDVAKVMASLYQKETVQSQLDAYAVGQRDAVAAGIATLRHIPSFERRA